MTGLNLYDKVIYSEEASLCRYGWPPLIFSGENVSKYPIQFNIAGGRESPAMMRGSGAPEEGGWNQVPVSGKSNRSIQQVDSSKLKTFTRVSHFSNYSAISFLSNTSKQTIFATLHKSWYDGLKTGWLKEIVKQSG